jgi:hypothetical protein
MKSVPGGISLLSAVLVAALGLLPAEATTQPNGKCTEYAIRPTQLCALMNPAPA